MDSAIDNSGIENYNGSQDIFKGFVPAVSVVFDTTDNTIDLLDSTTYPVLVATPGAPTAALAGAGAGLVDDGAHLYKVTFVTASGQTVGSAASGSVTTITASNGKVSLSAIPVSTNPLVVGRKIYRTLAGGSTYKLLATISDNTTTVYTDNIADASLGATLSATSTADGPKSFNYNIVDLYGKQVTGSAAASDIDVSGLFLSEELNINVTITTADGLQATGFVEVEYSVTRPVGFWKYTKTYAEVVNPTIPNM